MILNGVDIDNGIAEFNNREIKRNYLGIDYLDDALGGISNNDLLIIGARAGAGKCLGKGTKVLMYNGEFKNVEDIKTGDVLMGVDSTPRNVLALGRGRETMYKITMRDGSTYTVNESHILSLKYHDDYKKENKVINIEVKDYLKKSNRFKRKCFGYRPQIPLEFSNPISLEIDAYLLGLWIADGRKDRVSFSVNNKDVEIIDYLQEKAKKYNADITFSNIQTNSRDINIVFKNENIILEFLKDKNMYKNKHIPQDLKSMSIENRLQLLAGYIDGDGCVLNGNTVCFSATSSNEIIIKDIQHVARSLGFSANYKTRKRLDKRTNKEYISHDIIIGGDIERIPTKLSRKKINYKTRKHDWNIQSFKVEKLKVDKFYGFQIDGDKLFIIEDFCVTHNTEIASLIAQNLANSKNIVFYALEAERNEIFMRILYREFSKLYYQEQSGFITYRNFYYKDYDLICEKYIKQAKINLDTSFINLQIIYKEQEEITALKIQEDISFRHESTDLFVIDHLHYIDIDDANELRGMKKLVKTLRDTVLIYNTPILLIAHLRKKDKNFSSLVPDIDDFMGSSDITKIATKVVTFAPYHDDMVQEYYRCPTLIQVVKNRIDSTCTKYIAEVFFNIKQNKYEGGYFLGLSNECKNKFVSIENEEKVPKWSKKLLNNFKGGFYDVPKDR
jgi:replicative DNA helicase